MWLSEEYMIENETTEEWPFRMRAVCAIHCLQGDTCSLQCSLSARGDSRGAHFGTKSPTVPVTHPLSAPFLVITLYWLWFICMNEAVNVVGRPNAMKQTELDMQISKTV